MLEAAEALRPVFAERAAEHDRDATFPHQNFADLHAAGLLNLTVPRALGGEGLGLETPLRVLQAVAGGDASTGLVLAMQYTFHAALDIPDSRWPRAVYEEVVRASIEGVSLINAIRVEPELGTPARGGLPATTATKTANGWRLDGHKIYVTGSPALGYYLLWAKTDEEPARVGTFAVPAGTPGTRIERTWDHLGMRATGSDDLILEGAEIADAYAVDVRLPEEWIPRDPRVAYWNSLAISAVYTGVAHAARDWAVRFAQERVPTNLGRALATLPRFQTDIGRIEALLYQNEQILYGLAARIDRDGPNAGTGRQAQLVKYTTTNNDVQVAQIAADLGGNPGLTRRQPLERHLRDALCSRIHTPQDDSILIAAGKFALGLE
ncbi:MAG: acyl-CoA/acyl-ACP dehydrogenase [Chloroflexi bacterium]|nr:acyl-CoA/acyl-ACP dehydrogenase [Chloroflexota bacterium]MDA1146081.1 acyl-CoA/acyl-ACP dehydrogenase [Chloroflexota bacterium]